MAEEKRIPPTWLNKEFLKDILQKQWKEPELEILDLKISPAVAVGDNYASLIYRTTLVILRKAGKPEEKVSLICKTLSASEKIQELCEAMPFFEQEANVLMKVMPKINNLLKEALPDHEPLSAECLDYGVKPVQYLLLEDLKVQGFQLADRINGLDWNTVQIVLAGHAKLHAGSLALMQKEPSSLDAYNNNLWLQAEPDDVNKMIESSLVCAIKAASTWPDFPKEYLNKLKEQETRIIERKNQALTCDETTLKVLQHGDSWISNMMFTKGKDDVFNKIRFVDFQCSCLCSAAMDLNYFLFSSPSPDIRFTKIDEALEIYHQVFTDTINKLGVKLPRTFTLSELKAEFKRRSYFGFLSLLCVYPITITEVADVMDAGEFFGETDGKLKMYQNERFKKTLQLAMPYFVKNGVL